MYDIHVALPCTVVSFDGRVADLKADVYQYKELPIITCVPVAYFGNSGASIYFNIKPGDRVIAIFPQLDISQLVATGEGGEVPCTERFNITNCIVLPFGLPSLKSDAKICTADLKIVGSDIQIEGNVKILGKLDINGIDFSTHVHGGVTPGGSVTSVPAPGGI